MDSQSNFNQQSMHIKTDTTFSLISPPTTPSPPASCRTSSSLTSSGSKRPRPYPAVSREPFYTMSNTPAFQSWSSTGRPHPVERKPTDGDKLSGYPVPPQFSPSYIPSMPNGSDLGSLSSSSSLIGAMGETTINPRRSHSSAGRRMPVNPQPPSHNVMWDNTPYRTVPGHNVSFANMNPSLMTMDNYATTRSFSPAPSQSPNYQGHPVHYGQGHSPTQPPGNNGMAYEGVAQSSYPSPLTPSSYDTEDEVNRLRRRIRELELECTRNRNTIDSLRRPAANGLPTPSPSPSFQESWKARTEIRRKMFCSPNRAGNALCSWHDSRRERRTYPPRQAPPGYLNCGCSHEEALFEETLSRHNVGSYRPGDAVRMDPALRNPLLKLLENRYGYKDGDFERDPLNDRWIDGESPSSWELKAQTGPANRRRSDDRH